MDPTRNTPQDGDFSDSDQQWFDRLSGKLVVASDEAALAEADALRRALALERSAAEADPRLTAATQPAEQARRWERLQFRLRQERLVDGRPAWQRRWLPASAAAAAVLVMAVVLLPRLSDDGRVYYDEPPVMRGELHLIHRQDARPKESAEALAATLRAAGLQPALYQQRKTFSVDIDVAADAAPGALDSLRRAGIEPLPGLTRVEIAPR